MKIDKTGVYKMRCGGEIEIPYINQNNGQYPIANRDGCHPTWTIEGRFYNNNTESPLDLVEYLRPLPVKMQLGWWQARNGDIFQVTKHDTTEDLWLGIMNWDSTGHWVYSNYEKDDSDLINYLGNSEKPDFTLYQ